LTEDGRGRARDRFLDVDRRLPRKPTFGGPLAHVASELEANVAALLELLRLPAGSSLLDFGCADQPYRDLVPSGVRYIGADLEGNRDAAVHVDGDGRLDVDDHSIDAVLSTQVLEHVREPAAYLAEARRVLKPGGRLALTTHGLMRLHRDPIDLWRWTSDGLVHELERAGFVVERSWGIVGPAAAGLQLVQDATIMRVPARARPLFAGLMQRAVAYLDRHQAQEARDRDAMVLAVVARSPDG